MSLSLTTRLLEGVKRAYIWLRTDTRNSHVELGRGTRLNVGCEIRGPVELGNFCAIGRHVTFQGRNHVYTKPSAQVQFYRTYFDDELGYDAEGISVGHDVWIGNRVIILPDVEVGHGAILGAGAVVTSDIKPFEIVGGTPAEHIGWRYPAHIRDQLLELEWWHWSESRIERNHEFFSTDLTKLGAERDLTELVV
jgi:virginiamycin A acetyltransferase